MEKNATYRKASWTLAGLAGLLAALLFMADPIPQNTDYHLFADQVTYFLVPNFWNVISNFPFVPVALFGLTSASLKKLPGPEKAAFYCLFFGILLTAAGSAYYHFAPDNLTLIPDRLPMTLTFASFFWLIFSDLTNIRRTSHLFLFIGIGLGGILFWYLWDDLRAYIFVQFFPILGITAGLLFFRKQMRAVRPILGTYLLYALAKIFEAGDYFCYEISGFGGHALKHFAAAGASLFFIFILREYAQNLAVNPEKSH